MAQRLGDKTYSTSYVKTISLFSLISCGAISLVTGQESLVSFPSESRVCLTEKVSTSKPTTRKPIEFVESGSAKWSKLDVLFLSRGSW